VYISDLCTLTFWLFLLVFTAMISDKVPFLSVCSLTSLSHTLWTRSGPCWWKQCRRGWQNNYAAEVPMAGAAAVDKTALCWKLKLLSTVSGSRSFINLFPFSYEWPPTNPNLHCRNEIHFISFHFIHFTSSVEMDPTFCYDIRPKLNVRPNIWP